jgi:PAS domain-containing protein
MTGADTEDSRGSERRILHVTDDTETRQQLASHVDSVEDIDVVGVSDRQQAKETLDGTIDCLVVDPTLIDRNWAAFHENLPTNVPVILFTDRDPMAIPDEVLADADSLVERGDREHREFLVRKVRSLTSDPVTGSRQRRTDAESLAAERRKGLETFLVDETGEIVWASADFGSVFPGTETPQSADFYERLSAVLADRPAAASDVLALRGSDAVREGELLPITLATGGRRDVVHCNYPLPERAGATRLELFEDLTVGRERKERLLLFETLVMGAQDGLYTLDANGTIDFCNPAMAQLLG